jgi:hypothetical protein
VAWEAKEAAVPSPVVKVSRTRCPVVWEAVAAEKAAGTEMAAATAAAAAAEVVAVVKEVGT